VSLLAEFGTMVSTRATPRDEPRSMVIRRRVVVGVVLVLGAVLLGISLNQKPGDPAFYWLTLGLAAVWAIGARLSGPLHLGHLRFRTRSRRPVLTGTFIGLLVGGAFIVGGLVARQIPPVRDYIVQVLEFANYGPLLLVVFITVVNGVAEEMFFRGALYSALGSFQPVLISTLVYVVAVSAAGNPMLGFAGLILGYVCAYERRMTGGVLAPMLTHFFWGLVMVLALPPIFGV
jgi:membrane protease YdiL (CAAX protease family)